ncbi:DUF2357 domain-containing protein, partial [Mogibacterium timidum]|uniref:DUF2357 domain-containing protein n=1 Tax=Mogibacterium timidum TaxID=35519 RepID=UPI0028D79070
MTANSDELIYLQTDLVAITVKGPASHPEFPGVEIKDKESTLKVSCDDHYELTLAGDPETLSLQYFGKTSTGTYALRPLFFEQQRYEIVIEPMEGHTAEFWHENQNLRKAVTPVRHRSSIQSGILNFGNDIGLSDIFVLVDGHSYIKLTIEVFPSKISYREDYKAIVADITAEVYNLVFDFLKKTYDSFDVSSGRQSSPVEFFAIIQKIYQEFITAADMVLNKPHHLLQAEHVVLPGHKVKQTDNRTIRWIEKYPDHAEKTAAGVVADKALAVRKYVTYDTNENRLTKYMLQNTVQRLE